MFITERRWLFGNHESAAIRTLPSSKLGANCRGAQTLRAGSLLATPKYQKGSPPPAHTLRVFDAQLDADRDHAWFDISLARFLRAVCKNRASMHEACQRNGTDMVQRDGTR